MHAAQAYLIRLLVTGSILICVWLPAWTRSVQRTVYSGISKPSLLAVTTAGVVYRRRFRPGSGWKDLRLGLGKSAPGLACFGPTGQWMLNEELSSLSHRRWSGRTWFWRLPMEASNVAEEGIEEIGDMAPLPRGGLVLARTHGVVAFGERRGRWNGLRVSGRFGRVRLHVEGAPTQSTGPITGPEAARPFEFWMSLLMVTPTEIWLAAEGQDEVLVTDHRLRPRFSVYSPGLTVIGCFRTGQERCFVLFHDTRSRRMLGATVRLRDGRGVLDVLRGASFARTDVEVCRNWARCGNWMYSAWQRYPKYTPTDVPPPLLFGVALHGRRCTVRPVPKGMDRFVGIHKGLLVFLEIRGRRQYAAMLRPDDLRAVGRIPLPLGSKQLVLLGDGLGSPAAPTQVYIAPP